MSPAWKPNLNALPAVVNAPRTDAIYNCHSYLTKVPVGAIRPFIEVFTKPGEVVVDFFAGSGMTGLAAATSGRIGRLAMLHMRRIVFRTSGKGAMPNLSPACVAEAGPHAVIVESPIRAKRKK